MCVCGKVRLKCLYSINVVIFLHLIQLSIAKFLEEMKSKHRIHRDAVYIKERVELVRHKILPSFIAKKENSIFIRNYLLLISLANSFFFFFI